jgi:hypothetical protein
LAREEFIRQGPPPGKPPPRATISTFTRARQGNRVFWTKHFDLSIRYVGHAEKWDETLVEGDLAHRNGLVRFRRAGRDLAVANVERDTDFLRAELAMEGESVLVSRPSG